MSSIETAKPNSVKQGDTEPLSAVLADTLGPVNLAGSTVRFRMKSRVAGAGHPPIDAPAQNLQSVDGNGRITNKGLVQYPWAAGETDLPGVYGVEWQVTFADGKKRTFPNDRTTTFEIEPNAT